MTTITTSAPAPFPSLHGADFSADRAHRLLLWRIQDLGGPFLGWLMLNPSVADERRNDATTTCNYERARRLGYAGILQANLYTYRTPSPAALMEAGYPGSRDEAALLRLADHCPDIVCAWGAHARPEDAAHAVDYLRRRERPPQLWHLGLTKDGMPRHPLRVPYGEAPRWGLQRLPANWRPAARGDAAEPLIAMAVYGGSDPT